MKLNLLKSLGVTAFAIFTIIGCSSSDDNGGNLNGDDDTAPVGTDEFEVIQKFDTSFISSGDVISVSALQNDGKILIATMNGIVRLNPDGTVDNSFHVSGVPNNNGASYYCKSIAVQNDGKILLGYYSFNGSNQVLFRLNANGSVDNSFTPNIKGEIDTYQRSVNAILPLNDGNIIIGGQFAKVDNHSYYYHLAKLDQTGSLIQDFQPRISPEILNDVSKLFSLSGNKFMVTGALFTNQYLAPLRANAIIFDHNGNLYEDFNFTEDLWVQHPAPSLKRILSVEVLSDENFLFGGNFSSIMKVNKNGNRIGDLSLSNEQINTICAFDSNRFLIGSETMTSFLDEQYTKFFSVYDLSSNTRKTISLGYDDGIVKNIIEESGDAYLLLGRFQKGSEVTNIIRVKKHP